MDCCDVSMRYLIFGGTGSLAKVLIERILKDKKGFVFAFSRSEEKHVKIRQQFPEIQTIIGDIRDYDSVLNAIIDICPTHIIQAAALKNVPECEEFPLEAIKTNLLGSQNIVKAVENYIPYRTRMSDLKILSISTDKACKPVNAYGMTKALQEKIHLRGKRAIFNCVRYGNVLESRGSVIPFFKDKLEKGEKLPITDPNMTRFLMSLDQSVNLIFKALEDYEGGKIFIPKIGSAKIIDLAEVMLEHYKLPADHVEYVGIRPGEKINESLISEEEIYRTQELDDVFVVHDILKKVKYDDLEEEYSSGDPRYLMSKHKLKAFLKKHGVI